MVCPYSNAGYDKCYVTHLTDENRDKAYYYCGGGGQHKSCHIYPELVAKDIAALEKKVFLGSGPVLLPETHLNHFLFFYRDTFSKMQVFIPFLLDGIAKNEKCLYLSMDDFPSQVRIYLNSGGIPPGKVDVLPSTDWYLAGGKFDAVSSQKKYEETMAQAIQEGYAGLRVIGDGGSLFQRVKGESLEELLGYEEKMHGLLGNMAMQALCAYDVNTLPMNAFHRLMESHHIFAAPLTERQLSLISHFLPSLEVDEIAYHVGELKERKMKFVRMRGVGYLFCEAPVHRFAEKDVTPFPSQNSNAYLESLVDEVTHLLIQEASRPN
ncbi:MAG: MEDS domain-containing protein [Candidatus Omnitrophica bacterium]|nr:MEDS domain-containing protein [Candidatus Omnitrophota bacterium]